MNIINLMIALLLGLSGIALRFFKAYWLISGYESPSAGKDKKCCHDKMCRSVGNFMFLLSGIVFVMVIGEFLRWGSHSMVATVGWIFFILVIMLKIHFIHVKKTHYNQHRTNNR